MGNILIRDVPEDIHKELARKAECSGRSLQQYLLLELRRLANTVSKDEWLEDLRRTRGGGVSGNFPSAADILREEREQH
jgi:hypothetical protein